jgi:hypothetical protein
MGARLSSLSRGVRRGARRGHPRDPAGNARARAEHAGAVRRSPLVDRSRSLPGNVARFGAEGAALRAFVRRRKQMVRILRYTQFQERRRFHNERCQDGAIKIPSKSVLCRGPESNWRHMVLQVNVRRPRGFIPDLSRVAIWFEDKSFGSRLPLAPGNRPAVLIHDCPATEWCC